MHKWLGYQHQIQILAWLLDGLMVVTVPLDTVRGKHLAKRQIDSPFSALNYPANLNYITKQVQTVSHISFIHFLDPPIIKVKGEQPLGVMVLQESNLTHPLKKKLHNKPLFTI